MLGYRVEDVFRSIRTSDFGVPSWLWNSALYLIVFDGDQCQHVLHFQEEFKSSRAVSEMANICGVCNGCSNAKDGLTCDKCRFGKHANLLSNIQGVFFNWSSPKNHEYGKKLKYQNWSSPKIHKYGKKLKYQTWSSPKIHIRHWRGNFRGYQFKSWKHFTYRQKTCDF